MPRVKKTQQAVVPTTALVASAHRYLGKAPRIFSPSTEWQKRCYHHYSHCGEARYAARYFGHAMSRAVLYIQTRDGKRSEDVMTTSLLEDLFAGSEGQAEMLENVGVHLTVAGECYLVGREVDGNDIWEVISVMEVISNAGGWQIKAADNENWIPLEEDDVVIRVWIPKPDRRWEADSPFRSMLPVLDEIEWLSRYIQAQTRSRLTGAGILLLPDTMTFPPPPPKEGQEQADLNQADSFMLTLGEAAMESLKGTGEPSEVVPIIVTAPAESIGDAKHLTFWTDLDENAREMRKDAIWRFALGMDLPPELVLGMGSNEGTGGGNSNGVSHWGAWMIEEQAIKLHIEPMLDVLCAALTGYYMRPEIPATTDRVAADTAPLRLRPDRSQESMELADRGWLKPLIAVRENGFSEEDMPTEEERREWLLMKIASGSATPEQVGAALMLLGIDLPMPAEPMEDAPRETPPPPSLEDHPIRPRDPSESPYGTYEVLVLRALERAGNRLRSKTQAKPPGKAYEVHCHIEANGTASQCLADAWDMAEVVLAGNPDTAKVVASLDSYVRTLFANKEPHDRDKFVAWCQESGI